MLDYEFINKFFTQIREQEIGIYANIYMGIQFLAVSFILLSFFYSYLENKLSWKSILQTFLYVILALQFADFAQYIDDLMAAYVESITFFEQEGQGLNAAISDLYENINLSNPWSLGDLFTSGIIVGIVYIFYGISWLVKVIGLPFFLINRGLFLFVIYLFTPIVIAMSILPQYRAMVFNLIKLFCSIYVLQYIYMLIDWILAAFVVYATNEINGEIIEMPFNTTTTAMSLMVVVILVSFCSVKLYASASTIASKIFNS